MSANPRVADYAIHPQFTDRWSPRAFTGESIPEETLLSFFEAARWAPSAYNSQPWRFLYARRDTPNWERFLGLLNEFNRGWAQHASALVIVISKTTFAVPGATEETQQGLDGNGFAGEGARGPAISELRVNGVFGNAWVGTHQEIPCYV